MEASTLGIVTSKYLLRQGIDPNDNNNWANS